MEGSDGLFGDAMDDPTTQEVFPLLLILVDPRSTNFELMQLTIQNEQNATVHDILGLNNDHNNIIYEFAQNEYLSNQENMTYVGICDFSTSLLYDSDTLLVSLLANQRGGNKRDTTATPGTSPLTTTSAESYPDPTRGKTGNDEKMEDNQTAATETPSEDDEIYVDASVDTNPKSQVRSSGIVLDDEELSTGSHPQYHPTPSNKVLIAVPSHSTAQECTFLARLIMGNAKVINSVRRYSSLFSCRGSHRPCFVPDVCASRFAKGASL